MRNLFLSFITDIDSHFIATNTGKITDLLKIPALKKQVNEIRALPKKF